MGHLYHGYVSHNQRVDQIISIYIYIKYMLPYGYVKIAIENNQDQQDHFAKSFPQETIWQMAHDGTQELAGNGPGILVFTVIASSFTWLHPA